MVDDDASDVAIGACLNAGFPGKIVLGDSNEVGCVHQAHGQMKDWVSAMVEG